MILSPVALLLDADAEGDHNHEVGEPDGEEQADERHDDLIKLVQRLSLHNTQHSNFKLTSTKTPSMALKCKAKAATPQQSRPLTDGKRKLKDGIKSKAKVVAA